MKTRSSPYTHPRTIRIREVSQLRPAARGTRQWSIQITSGAYAATRTLIDPFTTTCEARLRWALEDHPSRFPFAGHKAQEVSRELWGYAMSLMDQLDLPGVLSAVERERKNPKGSETEELTVEAAMQGLKGKKWFLDIEGWGWGAGGEGSQDGCLNGIHWEALENPEVWPGNMRPLIVVRRRVPSTDIVTRGPIVGIGSDAFRILVVVSHPMAENMSGTKTSSPRLVSRPLVDLVERLKTDGSVPIYLEILRPSSWKALENRLESGGKGFFHLIHFDVNARVTRLSRNETTATSATDGSGAQGKDEVSLSFVSERSPQKRIWKATSEVSALLALYNVKFVVLNAPRTAKAFGAVSSNFAESLVKSGVRAVVALPFRILNAGAEVLMSTFYRCFLGETWDLAMALSEARRAMMRVQQREGRFGVMLPVDDWIIPVIYHNGATEVSVIGSDPASGSSGGSPRSIDSRSFLSKFHGLLTSDHQRSPDSSSLLEKSVSITEFTEAPGREYDIFKIEQLLDTTVLHVTGAPGVGKTKLMTHLSWWWKTTSLVHDAFYFDYDKQPSLTPEMALLKIYLQLFATSPTEAYRKSSRGTSPRPSVRESKASFLSQWSSSSRSSSPTSDASDGTGDDNWMEKTVEKLKEKRYLIVLDSLESSEAEIKDDEVLKGEINEFLKMLQGGKSVVVVVGNKKESWLNDSLVKFGTYHLNRLEKTQAVELAESILEKSAGDRRKFQGAENSYYLDMILQLCDSNPLVMELVLPKIAQNLSSPLTILFEVLQGGISINHAPSIKPLRKLSSMLSRLDKDSKQLLLCLAPFYSRLPKDLDPYLHCLLYHKALPTTADASTMQLLLFKRPPSTHEMQRVKSILSSTGLLSRYSYIIRDLLSMGFLSEDAESETYHVHPLLTLFLQQTVANEKERATSMYDVEYSLVMRAFLDYYSQRSFAWSQNPAESYMDVLDELECEEANFLSAMTIPLMHSVPAKVFEEFPVHAFARYAAVAAMQNSREKSELIAEMCKKLLERAEEVGGDGGMRNVDERVLLVAAHASTWLCEYYADTDAIGAFKKQVEVSSGLLELVEENASCLDELAILEEQCAVQKSVVVQEGMVDGLRFRKPWVGLLTEFRDPRKKKKEEDEAEWGHIAQDFIRLQSVAVQAPLTDRFTACMRERLKHGLGEIYQEVRAAVACSPLRPFLQIYPWIPTALLNPPPYKTPLPRISAKLFLAYPSMLQLHLTRSNPHSTLSHLLSTLNLARQHCDTTLELPMHVLLAKHTFALRAHAETIAHVEYVHTLLPSTISTSAPAASLPHFPTLLHTTFLWGLSHNHLSQWTAASHAFLTALAISTHTADSTTTYCTLRKLAAIKRESSIGPMTVTELLLRALDLAYSPDSPPPVFVEDRGALLQRIISAMNSGLAGESRHAAIARFAAMRGKGVKEMGAFIDDVVALSKTIERVGVEGGVPPEETERELKGMYAEAEGMLFKRPMTPTGGLTAIMATP